jgi:hypothetical protein
MTDNNEAAANQPAFVASRPTPKTRIVIPGGGFGGVYTARRLERLLKRRPRSRRRRKPIRRENLAPVGRGLRV